MPEGALTARSPLLQEYDDHGWLTQTNVQMRQIDLGCKVVAPVFAGFVVAWGGEDLKVSYGGGGRGGGGVDGNDEET